MTPEPDPPPKSTRQRERSRSKSRSRVPARARNAVDGYAGFILGLLVWGWLVLPYLRGGTKEVKSTLMAKFLNKDLDGEWLP